MLQVKGLSKSFAQKKVLDDISFELHKGQICALLGINGAGKSTTLKLVTGWYKVQPEQVIINGYDLATRGLQARRQFGYLPESNPLNQQLRASDSLEFVAAAYGFSGKKGRAAIAKAVELCQLEEVLQLRISELSKGFKQRLGLAQAIVHQPALLILDEPTDGLDPLQKLEIRSMLSSLAQDCAILFSTHVLEEVDAFCNHCILLHQSRVLACGQPAELYRRANAANFADYYYKTLNR